MVRVTVELLPFGSEARKRTLGIMHIINDGTGNTYNGNYNVQILRSRGKLLRVEGFKRRSENVWKLIARALEHY